MTALSTAVLPVEPLASAGHLTGMDLEGILERVNRRLSVVKLTAGAASKAAGKPDAIRNLRRAIGDGNRQGVTVTTMAALAPVLATSVAWLMTGEGVPGPANIVPVMWIVSAGGTIETGVGQETEPLFEVEIPFQLTADVVGLQVRGESMWPRYDPDDILVVTRAGEPVERLVHCEAVVETADGNRFFKRVLPGSRRGIYDLESYNAPTMRNRKIVWASGLLVRVPSPRWRRISGTGVKEAVLKARSVDQDAVDE